MNPEKRNVFQSWWKCKFLRFLKKSKVELPNDPAISPGI
jgi:hypothetical protein